MKSLLFSISVFFALGTHAQVEVHADGGSFESITPWGDGYLGVVQTQAYAVMPKYRQYQYFSESGQMEWNKKITPFNFNNASVCHNESAFAYFVNMPFSKTAMLEKTSKTELLNLYQVDQSGNVKEKAISYSGALKSLSSSAKKMRQCYLGAYKDGIIFVGTADDKTYHIVQVDHAFNVNYQKTVFEWNEELWEKNKLSLVKYAMGEDVFSLIQMKHEGSELVTTIKTLDIASFDNIKEVTNSVDFEGYSLNSKSGFDVEYSTDELVFTDYERSKWKGDNLYIYPTLGAFTNYEYSDEGLRMYAYYRSIKAGTRKEIEKEGYLIYEMNSKVDADVEPLKDFAFESNASGSRAHAFHVSNEGEFFFISQQSKTSIVLKSSTEEGKKFDGKLSFAEVYLAYVTGEERAKSDAVDVLCFDGDKLVGIDFDGFQNTFGNTKKAIIYTY